MQLITTTGQDNRPSGPNDTGRPPATLWRWLRREGVWVLVALAVVYQGQMLVRNYVIPTAKPAWHLRNLPAVQRSAIIAFSWDFSRYIDFLNANIPVDATVAIPKPSQGQEFGYVAIMEYFLFPRTIIDCPPDVVVECVRNLSGPTTYIIAPNAIFPPREVADEIKKFVSFDGVKGVYVPKP